MGVALAFATVSCARVRPAEEKLVGTWEFRGLDAVGRVVFRRDHAVINLFPIDHSPYAKWGATSKGTWRLEGNDVVTDERLLIGDHPPQERQLHRIPILQIDSERLVRADGRSEFRRVTAVDEHLSQMVAGMYVLASTVTLASSVYIQRKSALRKFWLFAVAAALVMAWSTSVFVQALAQTGAVAVSISTLLSIALPTQVVGFLSVLLFTAAFARLALGVRAHNR